MALETELRQQQLDADHWNRTHPDEEPIILEPLPSWVPKALADAKSLLDG